MSTGGGDGGSVPPAPAPASASGGGAGGGAIGVGARVADKSGSVGTVRYVGPVATSKAAEQVYFGIEWDDPTRGKHDGSVVKDGETIRYFETDAGRGSFLKQNLVNRGVGFVAALRERYEGSTLDSVGGAGSVPTASGRELEVEFVGEDQIRAKQRIQRNRNVQLKESLVSFVDGEGAVKKLCPNIEDLDIRDNLLYSWESLAVLGEQLDRLAILNVAGNMFMPLEPPIASLLDDNFKALKVLVLSRTGVSWKDAATAAQHMPSLVELHLCENGMSSLGSSRISAATDDNPETISDFEFAAGLDHIKKINLDDNAIASWQEVWRLSRLPSLEALQLSGNKIAAIEYSAWASEAPTDIVPFASLKSVTLSRNSVASWSEIDKLNQFPAVTGLRFQRNPLTEDSGPTEIRMLAIARLGSLTSLNGSEVRSRERSDAEKTYLRRSGDVFAESVGEGSILDLFGAGSSAEEEHKADAASGTSLGMAPPVPKYERDSEHASRLLAEHPRYFDILDKHGGVLLAAASEGSRSTSLASNVVTVTLQSMAAESCMIEPSKKRLPLSMTVGNLKVMMNKLFTCDPTFQRLSYSDGSGMFPIALDDDMKPLSFFGVQDKGDILMEEIDRKEAERERAEKEAEQEARLKQQMAEGEAFRRHQQAVSAAQRAGATSAAAGSS